MVTNVLDHLSKWGWDIIFLLRLNKLLIKVPFLRKSVCKEELNRGGVAFDTGSFIACASAGRLPEVQLFTCAGILVNVPGTGGNTALHMSALHGHQSVVSHLLSMGSSVDAQNDAGDTALILAAREGHVDLVDCLLTHATNVNLRNQNGDTALIVAARMNRGKIVARLLQEERIDIHVQNNAEESALLEAARREYVSIVQLLQAEGATQWDLDRQAARWQLERDELFKVSCFLDAAQTGKVDLVKKFLLAGMNPDVQDEDGESALIVAARASQGVVVTELLDKLDSKEVNAQNNKHESALLEAARRAHQEIMQQLLNKGAQEEDLERKVARWQLEQDKMYTEADFISAVQKDNATLVEKFLVAGMDPNARNDHPDPALILAARSGYVDIVRCLLAQAGIKVNLANDAGDTALIIAAGENKGPIVLELLAKLTVDEINRRNKAGASALLEAARHEYEPIIELLRSHGAQEPDLVQKVARWELGTDFNDSRFIHAVQQGELSLIEKYLVAGMSPNTRNESGDSALILGARKGDIDIVNCLLGHQDIRVNLANDTDDTALIVAARQNRGMIVTRLLEHANIDMNARNKADASALLEAAQRGHEQVVQELQNKGAQESDLEKKVARRQLEQDGLYSEVHFVRAVAAGNIVLARKYLLAGMDVNSQDEQREPALIVAVRHRDPDMVRFLLDQAGTNINLKNRDGVSALELAAAREDVELVEILKRLPGAQMDVVRVARRRLQDIGLAFRVDVFIAQAAMGDEKLATLFLDAGMQPNAENEQGETALMEAAKNGQKRIVELLLGRGADVNLRNIFKVSALEAAERGGYAEISELLRKHGAKATDPSKESLVEAVVRGDLAAVETALNTGIIPDIYTENGEPILTAALRQEKTQIVQVLLRREATVNARDRTHRTALMRAAELGLIDMIPLLLKADARLEEVDEEGNTPLMLAIWNGQAQAVRALIEAGANLNIRDKSGRTVQMIAKHKGHPEIIKLLKDNGVVEESPEADLLAAAARGDRSAVEMLLIAGADPVVPDEIGNTPLALAASRGWIQVIEALKPTKSLIEKANDDGDTPFMQAARGGHLDILELFLNQEPNINAINKSDETALLQAAMAGKEAAVKLLAQKGANPNLAGSGTTPLLECCYHGQLEAAKVLLDKGADANQKLEYGFSALMIAIILGHADIVKELKDRNNQLGDLEGQVFLNALDGDEEGLKKLDLEAIGLDLNARDRDGWTALMVASREGFDSIVKLLLDRKAKTEIRSRDGQTTALLEAAMHGRTGVLKLLIPKTDLDADAATRALVEAAAQGHAEAVRILAEQAHACINGRTNGRVPLIEAAAKGHLAVVQVLLELKADKQKHGPTAILVAELHGHEKVVELLSGSGIQEGLKDARLLLAASKGNAEEVERLLSQPNPPKLSARDEDGRTALMKACEGGHLSVVNVLFAHMNESVRKAAAKDHDHRKRTPLMFAARGGDVQIVERLLAQEVTIQAESSNKRTALMEACKLGRFEIVKTLLDHMKPDSRSVAVNHQDKDGNTPLSEAYLQEERRRDKDYQEIIRLLLLNDAEIGRESAEFLSAVRRCNSTQVNTLIDRVDFKKLRLHGRTPLMLCADTGCLGVAEILIRKGADVNESDSQGFTALMLAVTSKHQEMLRLLLKSGADCDRLDANESNALIKAVQKEDPSMVSELLAARANVNHRDSVGNTALLVAVKKDNANMVRLLLTGERLLNLDTLDKDRRTALILAHLRGSRRLISERNSPALDELIAGVADPKLTEIELLLLRAGARKGWDEAEFIHAVQNQHLELVQDLLADGVDVNIRDRSGSTGLLIACLKDNREMAQSLIDHGASVNVRNEHDRTPLMEAAKQKKNGLALVECLYQADPSLDLNAQDKDGETALLEAARAGQAEIVQFLVEAGANVKATNRRGQAPIIEMSKYSFAAPIRVLLNHGANACAQDASHTTAILEAAKQGNLVILKLLLNRLKERLQTNERKRLLVINAIDPQSCTAVDWAAKGGFEDCVRLLRQHGGTTARESNLVVYTTPTGDHYHSYGCSRINVARENDNLTKRPLWSAMLNYEFCDVCAPSFASIDWTC